MEAPGLQCVMMQLVPLLLPVLVAVLCTQTTYTLSGLVLIMPPFLVTRPL